MSTNKEQKQVAEQEEHHKHYCLKCRKGFSCKEELRVHMWDHRITDEPVSEIDEESTTTTTATQMLTLSRNFKRRRTSLEQGRILRTPEGAPSSWRVQKGPCCFSANIDGQNDPSRPSSSRSCHTYELNCSGEKRNSLTEEEDDAANCLFMLSTHCFQSNSPVLFRENPSSPLPQRNPRALTLTPPPTPRRTFRCEDCFKAFSSHQALGGHRASHRKVMGCFAARDHQAQSSSQNMAPLTIVPFAEQPSQGTKSKMHECSICGREFSTGQALGGHKRSHRTTSNSADIIVVMVEPNEPHAQTVSQMLNSSDHQLLDLNLPLAMDDIVDLSLRLGVPITINILMNDNSVEEEKALNQNSDDEAESREVNLARLWDLDEANVGVERSTWLQIGRELNLATLWDLDDANAGVERSTWLQMGIGSMADEQSSTTNS